jgi:hypothetical protein
MPKKNAAPGKSSLQNESRRIKVGDRIVILPPESEGNIWSGSAR